MKKIFMLLIFILSSCTITDSISEIGVDNKDCIGVRRFKVLQVIGDSALAHECFTQDCSDYYHNTLDLITKDNVDYYDDMKLRPINVPLETEYINMKTNKEQSKQFQ